MKQGNWCQIEKISFLWIFVDLINEFIHDRMCIFDVVPCSNTDGSKYLLYCVESVAWVLCSDIYVIDHDPRLFLLIVLRMSSQKQIGSKVVHWCMHVNVCWSIFRSVNCFDHEWVRHKHALKYGFTDSQTDMVQDTIGILDDTFFLLMIQFDVTIKFQAIYLVVECIDMSVHPAAKECARRFEL